MKYYFTLHAKQKFELVEKAGFKLVPEQIISALEKPDRVEDRSDGTKISSQIIRKKYLVRVVWRKERDTIVIITFLDPQISSFAYPARRSDYEI